MKIQVSLHIHGVISESSLGIVSSCTHTTVTDQTVQMYMSEGTFSYAVAHMNFFVKKKKKKKKKKKSDQNTDLSNITVV